MLRCISWHSSHCAFLKLLSQAAGSCFYFSHKNSPYVRALIYRAKPVTGLRDAAVRAGCVSAGSSLLSGQTCSVQGKAAWKYGAEPFLKDFSPIILYFIF